MALHHSIERIPENETSEVINALAHATNNIAIAIDVYDLADSPAKKESAFNAIRIAREDAVSVLDRYRLLTD
ncbi:MAG: hypothetical protein AWU57_948 [Marinobacter sp. T13-3]|nr:MAG: hypothetical protein AWU57_948 [Marinobacter sp. T13-3]